MEYGLINLRIFGAIFGLLLLLIGISSFRKYKSERKFESSLGQIGIVLISVSFFPSFLNYPVEFLKLNNIAGARIIFLLIIISCFLVIMVLWERFRLITIKDSYDKLISNLALRKFIEDNPHLFYKSSIKQNKNTIWLVLPAFNEEENLLYILPKIPKKISKKQVRTIVSNDGSIDKTAEISEKFGALVLSHTVNRGGGLAHISAFNLIKKLGGQYIVTFDADGQNLPEEINRVVQPILDDECDVVIGSRQLGKHQTTHFLRTIGVPLFSTIISILMRKKITDCASNFRSFKSDVLDKITLKQEQYHTSEFVIEICKNNFRYKEVPISFMRRIKGQTKKGRSLLYGLFFIRTIIQTWLR